MSFTKLELAPHLNPLFDQCIHDCAQVPPGMSSARAVGKLKSDCLAAVKAEINRQGGIYTAEEKAYVTKIKRMHEEAKPLTFTLIEYAKKLADGWDDKLFAEMGPKANYVGQMSEEAHAELAGAVAHQGWRDNTPWDFTKAVAAIGQNGQTELFSLFKSHRDPMIAETADLKTFVIKLDEFHKRALDSVKTAAACQARARVDMTGFANEVKKLLANAIKAKQDIEVWAKNATEDLQKFVVLCNKQKTKLDPVEMKKAEINQAKGEIALKNNKTTTKTLEVEKANADLRVQKSVIPSQAGLVTGALAEAGRNLEAARKSLEAFSSQLDVHKKKFAEAKTRK